MKCKKGITLAQAIELYNQKHMKLPYISDTKMESLEYEKGYTSFVVSSQEHMVDFLENLFSDDDLTTYINFYETNGTEIKGYRREVVVINFIEKEGEK